MYTGSFAVFDVNAGCHCISYGKLTTIFAFVMTHSLLDPYLNPEKIARFTGLSA